MQFKGAAAQHTSRPEQKERSRSKLLCTLHSMIVPGSKRTECLNSTRFTVFHVEFLKRTIFGLRLSGCTVYRI